MQPVGKWLACSIEIDIDSQIPEINITCDARINCLLNMQKRQLYFWQNEHRTPQRHQQRPRLGSMCVCVLHSILLRTVDLALTHLNNVLSFDNGPTHAASKAKTTKMMAKMTRHAPSFLPRSLCTRIIVIFIYFLADPFSILNFEA